MANRYNTYQNVDYVHAPIEAYQMALGSQEADRMAELAASKQQLDLLNSIEASYPSDKELRGSVIDKLYSDIGDLSNKNLRSQDTMLRINKLLNDPSVINPLSEIQRNTLTYKKAITDNEAYQKESGNDINTLRFKDEVAAYSKLGKEGFKPGFMAGYTPGKFVDVVGDMQKVLEKAKADGWKESFNGKDGWIYTKDDKKLTMDKLLQQSGLLLNDPKYQTQLEHLHYAGLRPYGGNINEEGAYDVYHQLHVGALDNQISYIGDNLQSMIKLHGKDPKFEKQIEDGKKAINQLNNERDSYAGGNSKALYNQEFLHGLAASASAPFPFNEHSLTQTVDPYASALYKANLADRNNLRNFNRHRKAELDDRTHDENPPVNPTIGTVVLKDGNGVEETQGSFVLDSKGGYSPERLATTISSILNTSPVLLDENSNPVNDKFSIKDKRRLNQNLTEAINTGNATVAYLPGTQQYMITDKNGKIYRLKADLGMQAAFENLTQFYGNTPIEGKKNVQVSLDGKTLSDVYITRQEGEKDSHIFTPLSKTFNRKDLSLKDIETLTGISSSIPREGSFKWEDKFPGQSKPNVPRSDNMSILDMVESDLPGEKRSKPTFKKDSDIYIIAQGYFPDKHDGNGQPVKVYKFSPKKLLQARELGFVEEQTFTYNQEGNKIQPVQGIYGGQANSNIIHSQIQYQSQPGGELYNLRDSRTSKTTKVHDRSSTIESSAESFDNAVQDYQQAVNPLN